MHCSRIFTNLEIQSYLNNFNIHVQSTAIGSYVVYSFARSFFLEIFQHFISLAVVNVKSPDAVVTYVESCACFPFALLIPSARFRVDIFVFILRLLTLEGRQCLPAQTAHKGHLHYASAAQDCSTVSMS